MNNQKNERTFNLNGRLIGEGEPVYIIAEGGCTNWGELDLAKKQVDMAMAAGADAIKFQVQTTEALISKKNSPEWYKKAKYKELSYDDLKELQKYCEIRNIEFFVTAHTEIDLDFVDKELNQAFLKIGGGESINEIFLKNVGSRKKPVLLSTGFLKNNKEIEKSVDILKKAGATYVIILHCNSIYPTPANVGNLQMIEEIKNKFGSVVGYSDHSVGWHIPLAAVSMGAKIIEKHISFDKEDKRSMDSAGSCTSEDLKLMVSQIREIEEAMKENLMQRSEEIDRKSIWAKQSVVAAKEIKKGDTITKDSITYKRPGTGIPEKEKDIVLGKKAKKDIHIDELITKKEI